MPYHFDGKVYKTFEGLQRAIHTKHPAWSAERVRRYAGSLYQKQVRHAKGEAKHGKTQRK